MPNIVVATETFISGGAVVGVLSVAVRGVTTLCKNCIVSINGFSLEVIRKAIIVNSK